MKFNIHLYIFLIFACLAFVNDIILYFFNIDYNISLLISAFIVLIVNIILKKYNKIKIECNWDKLDCLLFINFITYLIVSGIIFPEYVHDSVSYHIYLQEYFPIDKVNFDFFPCRIYCCFVFPLGDRMYYIFRHFGGLRFGTFLSFYAIIIVYYQVKLILNVLTQNSKKVPLYSYFIFLVFAFIRYTGTYYIDNLGLICLLEMFYIIIKEQDILEVKIKQYILMLIAGVAIGIKYTNACYVLILLFYLILKNKNQYKKIKISNVLISIFLIILPYFVYMIDNYKQVGSVIFPYFNAILNSKYFGKFNWCDIRFGINGIFQKIIWPFILGLKFDKYGDETVWYDPIVSISFIIINIYLIKNIIKKKKEVINNFIILWYFLDCIWILIMYGYSRYGVFVEVLCVILAIAIVVNFIDKKEYLKFDELFKEIFFIVAVVVSMILSVYFILINTDFDNLKYLFKDRDESKYKIHIDGVWGAPYDSSCFVSLIREKDTPIYNLCCHYFEESEISMQMWREKVVNTDKDIYTIIDSYGDELENCSRYKLIEDDGFEVTEVVNIYTSEDIPYINAHSVWYLVKIKYVESKKHLIY